MMVGSKKKPFSPARWPPVSILAVRRQVLHHGGDRVEVVDVVQRAEVVVLVVLRAGVQGLGVLHHGCHDVVVDRVLDQHTGDGGAVLAGVEEGELGDGRGALLDVGVREHDGRGLAAEFQVGALEALRGAGGDGDAGPDGAGDGDQAGDLVIHHHGAGLAGAQDDVQDAGREDSPASRASTRVDSGRGVRGLQDHGVAGGERGADLPDGHQERVVPRGHLGRRRRSVRGGRRRCGPRSIRRRTCLPGCGRRRRRSAAGRRRRHFLGGDQGADLAGVAVLGVDEFVAVGLDGVGELEEHQLALAGGGVLPGLEGVLGGGHGGVDVCLHGDGRLGHHVAGRGIHDVQQAGAGRRDELAVDEVLQGLNHGVQPLSC